MHRVVPAEGALRALLLALFALALIAPPQAQATELMVEHFDRPGTEARTFAYVAAGRMGARLARRIVEGGTAPDSFVWNVPWSGSERPESVRDFVTDAVANEMRPYLTLSASGVPSTQDFAFYCRQAVLQNPEVFDFSVWNEPNLTGGNYLTPAEYRSLYRACQAEIRSLRPAARVYIGELETGLGGGISACAYFDSVASSRTQPLETSGLALHPYQFTTFPTTRLNDVPCHGIGNIDVWQTRLQAAVSEGRVTGLGGGRPQLIVSEFGYCSPRPDARPGFPYTEFSAVGSCGPKGQDGVANAQLDEGTRAAWIQAAFAHASANGVQIFDYHGIIQRDPWSFSGDDNQRCPADGSNQNRTAEGGWICHRRDSPFIYETYPNRGYLWNSGIVRYVDGVDLPSVGGLRAANGVVNAGVVTGPATGVTTSSATLNGTVTPNGFATTYHFEYGTTAGYGTSTPDVFAGAGSSPVAVAQAIHGLRQDTTYHYRLVAISRTGASSTADATFTTPPLPQPSGFAVVSDPGRIELFGRTSGQSIQRKFYPLGTGWSLWEPLGTERWASEPIATTQGGGHVDVYALGTDSALWHRWYRPIVGWSPWASLGGRLLGTPAPVSTGPDHLDVYARGADDSLQHRWMTPAGTFSEWQGLGGILTGDPAVVSWGRDRLDIFYRGSDGAVYTRHHEDGSGMSAEQNLGGAGIASDPIAITSAPGKIDLFARGADQSLMHTWYESGRWWGWESLGGTLAGKPTAISWDPGHLSVFANSPGGELMHKRWFNGAWSSWEPLGGQLASDTTVDAISTGYGHTDVYAKSASGVMGHAYVLNGQTTWTRFAPLTIGDTTPAPASAGFAVVPSAGHVDLFARAADQSLQHRWYPNGTTWSPWESLDTRWNWASEPVAITQGSGHEDVYVRGLDNGLYHRWYRPADGWSPWTNLNGSILGTPAPVTSGGSHLDVYARGTDDTLQHRWMTDAGVFSAWQGLGGSISGDPAVVTWGRGRIDAVARGRDGTLVHLAYEDGVGWSPWENLGGGAMASDPAANASARGRVEVIARGSDQALMYKQLEDGTWSSWVSLGGRFVGRPAAISWGPGHVSVFANSWTGELMHRRLLNGSWSSWESLGGQLAPDTAIDAISTGYGHIDVYAKNSAGVMGHAYILNGQTSWTRFAPL